MLFALAIAYVGGLAAWLGFFAVLWWRESHEEDAEGPGPLSAYAIGGLGLLWPVLAVLGALVGFAVWLGLLLAPETFRPLVTRGRDEDEGGSPT